MSIKREIPILFSTIMVQALLAGRKTQTRRIAKKHPAENWTEEEGDGVHHSYREWYNEDDGMTEAATWLVLNGDGDTEDILGDCPYGKPCDILWVKETHYRYGHWEPDGLTKKGKTKWKFVPDTDVVMYSDNPPTYFLKSMHKKFPDEPLWYKRNSLFMLKESARLYLQVKLICVERLQDISEEDAIAEGIKEHKTKIDTISYYDYTTGYCNGLFTPSRSFRSLWESINGTESWEVNPWLWVVKFSVLSTTGRPAELWKEELS